MQSRDFLKLTSSAIFAHRLRSSLTILGIAVGIAAVVLLTSIGEGVHQFILSEFSQFGTNLISISPGRTTTSGQSLGMFGNELPLTIEDAEALKKLPETSAVTAVVQGNAEVEAGNRRRRTMVQAVGSQMPEVFSVRVQLGRFLPEDDPVAPRAYAVLGSKLRDELFADQNPLGQRITIGGDRFRVIGVMESKGSILGFDLDDTVYIPTARGLSLFNRESLVEIDVLYPQHMPPEKVVRSIKQALQARHGREDFTVILQQQMLDVLGSVLNVITFAVGAIGAISLLVGAIGIVTIMTISVNERTSEIGLLRALGAQKQQILGLFLGEAIVLAMIGGLSGLFLGIGIAQMLHLFIPTLPVHTPLSYVLLAEISALLIGLLAGVLPARRASNLDPIEALRTE